MKIQLIKKIFCSVALCITSIAYCMWIPWLSIVLFPMMFLLGGLISYSSSFKYTLVSLLTAYFAVILSNSAYQVITGAVYYNVLISFAFPALSGVCCGLCFKRKSDFRTVFTVTSFCLLLVIIVHLAKTVYFDKVNIVDMYIRNPLKMFFYEFENSLKTIGYEDTLTEQSISSIVSTLIYSTPSLFIILAMFVGFFLMYILKKIIKALYREEKFEGMVPFSHLIMSPGSSAGFSLLFILSMFLSGMPGVIVSNILSVMMIMFYGCGLSLLDFYLKKIIRFSILRLLIYITGFTVLTSVMPMLIMVNPAMALVFASMLDSTRDFRKIRNPKFTIYIK